MTSARIEYFVQDGDVEKLLKTLDSRLNPLGIRTFLEGGVKNYIQERGKARFDSEGDEVSGPWLPLAPATQQIRSSQGYGAAHPINVRTGALERYIVGSPAATTTDPLGATMIYPGMKASGELGKKMERAQVGEGRTPARPVLGLDETDLANVLIMAAFWVNTGRHS